MKTTLKSMALALTALLLTPSARAPAQGIPEPGLTMYGVVRNITPTNSFRLTFGTLAWTIRPASGSPIVVAVPLTNLLDQFSYVLTVPFETEVGPFTVSPGALRLTAAPTEYSRLWVTVNGIRATNRPPASTNFWFSVADRGRIERVDLDVSLALPDSDGDGLPDGWELTYFGHLGHDGLQDPDGDGMPNAKEFGAGTNPNDPQSLFEFIEVQPASSGGVRVRWASVAGKVYELERSSDLLSGFVTLPTGGIEAVQAVTEYTDATATGPGPYFYRLRIKY